jgi:S1-C subfamily serine protease
MIKKAAALCMVVYLLQIGMIYADKPDEKLHKQCLYPTVMIISDNGCKSSMGSGVIVRSIEVEDRYLNLVFTSAHVIQKKQVEIEARHRIFVGQYENWSKLTSYIRYNDIKVLFINDDADVAVLSFESKEKLPTAIINPLPELYLGNEVYRIGCGEGEVFRLDYGKITGIKESLNVQQGMIRTSILTLPGDSGGPVFNNYELIGLAHSIKIVENGPYTYPINFVTYITPIESFLQFDDINKLLQVFK